MIDPASRINLEIITEAEVPDRALDYFESTAHEMTGEALELDRNHMLRITCGDGITTYGVDRKPSLPGAGEDVYLIDIGLDGKQKGEGWVEVAPERLRPNGLLVPFVGYTETAEDSRRQGLGLRRLKIMNEVSKLLFKNVLHSAEYDNVKPPAQET